MFASTCRHRLPTRYGHGHRRGRCHTLSIPGHPQDPSEVLGRADRSTLRPRSRRDTIRLVRERSPRLTRLSGDGNLIPAPSHTAIRGPRSAVGVALFVTATGFVVPSDSSAQDSTSRLGVAEYSAELGRILVRNDVPRRPDQDEWWLEEELRLGRVEGSGPDIFSDIRDLAVDDAGRIYVLDVGWQEVRVFRRDGRYLMSMAGDGGGPGEMRHRNRQSRIVWQPPNRMWIGNGHEQLALDTLGIELDRDSRGMMALRSGARPGRPADILSQGLEPIRIVIGVDTLGSVYQRIGGWGPRGGPVTEAYNRIARLRPSRAGEAQQEQTLLVEVSPMVAGETTVTRRASNTFNLTHSRPRPWRIAMALDPGGTVWLADRSAYRFHEVTFDGDTIRTVELGNPRQSSEEEIHFEAVLHSIDVSSDGWLWARRESRDRGANEATTWDLFDNCGRYRGPVTVPARLSALDVGSAGELHAVVSDALDVNYVVRLRLHHPDGIQLANEAC